MPTRFGTSPLREMVYMLRPRYFFGGKSCALADNDSAKGLFGSLRGETDG